MACCAPSLLSWSGMCSKQFHQTEDGIMKRESDGTDGFRRWHLLCIRLLRYHGCTWKAYKASNTAIYKSWGAKNMDLYRHTSDQKRSSLQTYLVHAINIRQGQSAAVRQDMSQTGSLNPWSYLFGCREGNCMHLGSCMLSQIKH